MMKSLVGHPSFLPTNRCLKYSSALVYCQPYMVWRCCNECHVYTAPGNMCYNAASTLCGKNSSSKGDYYNEIKSTVVPDQNKMSPLRSCSLTITFYGSLSHYQCFNTYCLCCSAIRTSTKSFACGGLYRPLACYPAISKEVEQVVFKVLSKDPQQRFASVADFAKALASIC